MNELLLGCCVWAMFLGLVAFASKAIQFLLPGSASWAPFAALVLVALAWFAVLIGTMMRSGKRSKEREK